jgi:hypothetical protein
MKQATTQISSKRVASLATKLFNLFWENNIQYFPPFESWAQQHSEEAWRSLHYTFILDLAHFSLHGLTKKKPTRELVKAVLIQIEQWMLQSNGEIAEVTFSNGTSSWIPVCLLESTSKKTR